MHLGGYQDVLMLVTYGLAILILSIVADRKHRSPLVWGLIGGLVFPCSLIYLALLPRLCPKCKAECKGKTCPNCDPLQGSAPHYPATGTSLNAADEQLTRFVWSACGIHRKPVRMCPVAFLVGAVRVHPGEDHEPIFVRGAAQLAEQVAFAQLLRRAVQWHMAWIISHNTICVDDDTLGVGAFPLLAPPCDVVSDGIDLRDVRLPPAYGPPIPRHLGLP